METFIEKTVGFLLKLVNNAVIFADDGYAESLHWDNGFIKLLDAGALDIRDIKHSKECLESETKCIFLLSTPVNGKVIKYIERIVKNSDFKHCIIASTLSNEINDFIYHNNKQVGIFDQLNRNLKQWMQNEFSIVSIYHNPLSFIEVSTDMFLMPTHNSLFPVLPSDVARLQAFLHSRGDKRIFNNLGDVDVGFLPHNMQCQIKMLASSFNSMFEVMDMHEDCYALGHFSRLLASELASMPDARGRRKIASSRASIIFVDRMLDLVAPTSHTSECVLGTIYEVLPRLKGHNNDVAVDMTMLFADGNVSSNTLFPGCLAHMGDAEIMNLIDTFVMKPKKVCISFVISKLKEVLENEGVGYDDVDGKDLNCLKKLLTLFKSNLGLFKAYSGLLQCSMALYNALSDDENDHLNELLSAEKVIMLDLGAGEGDPFAQILRLLAQNSNNKFSVVDALMFCMFIYSAGNDISNTSPAYEEKLKEALINILMDGEHKEDLMFIVGDLDASERQIRTRMADIFERLRGIGESRNEMRVLRSLITKDSHGMMKYKPMVSQVLERVFNPSRPDLVDIEFRSHGFKDFLKTGFGFFMNVSTPRPDDHPLVILFVVGGITWYEVKSIRETLKQLKPKQKVLIGSNRVITPTDTLEQVLCTENLFVDVES